MGMAVVVIANDFSAINVALPTMEKDFDTNINTIQWVVNAYALTFGVMIVTGGRLADMFGRRNAFFLGTAIFASMSALGGAAQSETWLIAAADADGDRRGADVAGDPRDDLRDPAGREGRPRRRHHHRRRRPRQRDRPADGRRPHRGAELALDLLPQRPDRDLRRRGHLLAGPRQGAGGRRAADRLRRDHGALGRARLAADRARPGRRLGLGRPAGDRDAGAGGGDDRAPSCQSSAGPEPTPWCRAR